MAFNPFNWFRKHQKKLIVVVTIFVMFIFILQFGKGDVIDRFAHWLGAKGDRGEVVATLYGSKVRESETNKISRQRRAASEFILLQVMGPESRAHNKALDSIAKELRSEPGANPIDDPMRQLREVVKNIQQRDPQRLGFMQFQLDPRMFFAMLQNFVEQQIPADLQLLEDVSSNKNFIKGDDAEKRLGILQKLATIVGYQHWQLAQVIIAVAQSQQGLSITPDDLIFGGHSKTMEDTLDFIMWKHHASKLDVQLTDADLAREINREAAGYEVFPDPEKIDLEKDGKIRTFLATKGEGLSPKEFIDGLRDEFRVVITQGILLGAEPGVRAYRSLTGGSTSPTSVSPGEFLNFYRRTRTTVKVDLLAVPAEKFLGQVVGEPNKDEIEKRFTRFKDREAFPNSRDPGFKESRRVLVQYVVADSKDPKHKEQAKKIADAWAAHDDPKWRADRSLGAVVGGTSILGAGPMGPVATLLAAAALDPVGTQYEKYVADQGHWLIYHTDPALFREEDPQWQSRLRHENVFSPRSIAALLGGLDPRAGCGPLAAVSLHITEATRVETRRAMRQVCGVRMMPGGSHSFADLLGTVTMAYAANPEVLTRQDMHSATMAVVEDRVSRDLVRTQFKSIQRELLRLRNEKDKEAIDKYLDKVVKESPGLKLVSMPVARSMLTLAEDLERKKDPQMTEALEPLRKRMPAQNERDFAAMLFIGTGTYEARRVRPRSDSPMRFMRPDAEPEYEGVEYLWWRKEDHPTRTPKDVSDVRDKVVLAMKMDQARVLARNAADKLADTINKNVREKKWGVSDAQRFLSEQKEKYGEPFELDNVSQFVTPPREVHALMRSEYRPYEIPADKKSLMPYDPPDLVDQLLTLEKPGRATVVSDMAHRTYYVAVLLARDEPTVRQFRDTYKKTAGTGMAGPTDPLYTIFARERTREYRMAVMKSLREEALGKGGKLSKDGRFEVPEEIKRREGRIDGEPSGGGD